MLGRWQPWHDGLEALFKRCVAKTGQVMIQVRDVQGAVDGDGQMIILLIGMRFVQTLKKVYLKMVSKRFWIQKC